MFQVFRYISTRRSVHKENCREHESTCIFAHFTQRAHGALQQDTLFLCILLFYRSTIGSVIENFEMSSSTTMFSDSMCVVVRSNVCILTEKKSNVTIYRCGAAAASSLT